MHPMHRPLQPADYVVDHGSGIRNETDNLGSSWVQRVRGVEQATFEDQGDGTR
jgi:hypothetical protein